MNDTTISLKKLIHNATEYLNELNYAKGTKQNYIGIWKHFQKYAITRNCDIFSLELGYAFLKFYFGIKKGMHFSNSQINKIRSIKILDDFIKYNSFQRCHKKKGKQVPYQFMPVLDEYTQLQAELYLTPRTIQGKRIKIIHFLSFIDRQKVTVIQELKSKHVLSYIKTLSSYSQSTKSGLLFTLRDFLTFLYSRSYTDAPINNLFPVIFSNKFERIPSYYSTDEIKKILLCIDRNSIIGCRDYLILILAVQLGMRAGDIKNLKFDNIKWNKDTIEFIQEKTKNHLQLPLLDNIKYALIDYMKNSRPKSNSKYIFVRQRAPFIHFASGHTFFDIINKYMKKANIFINHRRHGLHTMRHSLATNLLKQNIAFPVITGVLGHKNSDSTKLYLRISIEQLRSVALEVNYEK